MARPRKPFDEEELLRLVSIGMSFELAGEVMDISVSTIKRSLTRNPALAERVLKAKGTIRHRLWGEMIQRGLKGSDRMLIHALQRVIPTPTQLEISGKNGGTIELDMAASDRLFTDMKNVLTQIQNDKAALP
ncbi:hypothetical protein A0J51_03278 [Gluconobacter japonicus]|nr:hypothetical protein A0J51_03278 [Gluconobacter japonicus]